MNHFSHLASKAKLSKHPQPASSLPHQHSNSHSSSSRETSSSNLETLIRMGFSKDRAEKALAWTGDVGVYAAVDWILSHKDDLSLDKKDRREYLVYLCPAGALLEHIQTFLDKSATECGRNGAHLHLSHITMCHGFKAEDARISAMLKILGDSCQRIADHLPSKVTLDRYTSENFMGLFLDNQSERVLKEFSQYLVQEIQSFCDDEILTNSKKAFHLTLAYHFDSGDYETLLSLSKRIDLKAAAKWYFRLYSRDPRFNSHEVYQMVKEWQPPGDIDAEPLYTTGDYLYVSTKESDTHPHPTGFVFGHSWLTGRPGIYPLSHLQKTFDSDVWLLHGSIPFLSKDGGLEPAHYPPAQRNRWVQGMSNGSGSVMQNSGSRLSVMDGVDGKEGKKRGVDRKNCTVYVMRHGERMDFVFGWDWIKKCFDEQGNFVRCDLNMPKAVPKRRTGATAYISDPPLTAIGLLQAQITGKAMKDAGIAFTRIFVSPALRSVQTATAVLESICCSEKRTPKLCVEPGLYEWLGWVKQDHPEWLSTADLHAFGIPVDMDYRSFFDPGQLNYEETVDEYYTRNGMVVRRALEVYGHEGGNFLFVGHASSLDTCTRQLCGAAPRNQFEMNKVTQRVPYCAVVTCCQGPDQIWVLKNPPFPSLTHGANIKFNAAVTFADPARNNI